MKILIAYSSKTKNTQKVAIAIYEAMKDKVNVDLIDIKKIKKPLEQNYNLYILGAWVDKTTANKNMQRFIEEQNIKNKNVALFMTCGVPKDHPHAEESMENYKKFMENFNNKVQSTFICQGKIDPKIIIVFRVLTWRDPNFIHKVTPELKEMVRLSKPHPTKTDLEDAKNCFENLINNYDTLN